MLATQNLFQILDGTALSGVRSEIPKYRTDTHGLMLGMRAQNQLKSASKTLLWSTTSRRPLMTPETHILESQVATPLHCSAGKHNPEGKQVKARYDNACKNQIHTI
jgi:hypothetical protein